MSLLTKHQRSTQRFNQQRTGTVSIELVLISTIAVLGLIAGASAIRDAVLSELADFSGATQNLNQSLVYSGVTSSSTSTAGANFVDNSDFCDDDEDPAGEFEAGIVLSSPIQEGDVVATPSGDDGGGGDGGGGDDGGGGGDGGGGDLGTPADGTLVSDNFQDGNGNAPFNLQVRNTTNTATPWRAVIPAAPYATIPGLTAGPYTLVTTPNGDGTFQHVFTGTSDLGAFQNVTIQGGLPSPPGVGGAGNLDLFIP
jgi:hypothetical protein